MTQPIVRYTGKANETIARVGFAVSHGTIYETFQQHQHDFNEIAIIVSGSATHVLGDEQYPLRRGDILAIKGDTVHGYTDVQSLNIINLMYDERIFQENMYQLQQVPGFRPLFLTEPAIRPFGQYRTVQRLDEEALEYTCIAADNLQSQLSGQNHQVALLFSFFALAAYIASQYQLEEGKLQQMQALASALQFIELNWEQRITLNDLAQIMNLSARQVQRIFGELCGISPMTYLRNVRLKHARELLLQPHSRVTEVAMGCGFDDPAYFARVFKQVYGITPHEVKKSGGEA